MNEKFAEFYKELSELLKKYAVEGMSHEEIIGGIESAKMYVSFLLKEEYKRRAVFASWEATKKYHGRELAKSEAVVATEDN